MLVNNIKSDKIYLDNAATTPLDERVLREMLPFLHGNYGNPSSIHSFGVFAKDVLEESRSELAKLIHCLPEEIVFTSSGTESNNAAIKGIAFENRSKGNHIIVSSIEHDCVLNACKWLEDQGFFITYLPVDSFGIVDIDRLKKYINPKTILVSVMHANNEIGTIQPIEEIGKICKEKGVCFHTDACQSFGKIPVNFQSAHLDLLTLNAHKINGPKGVGALIIRKGTKIAPLLHGGGQERGWRSSTENIPGIIGFVKAAQLAIAQLSMEAKKIGRMRDRLEKYILENIDGAYINGHPTLRLHTNINFSIQGLEGETMRLLLLLDEKGIAVSAGSACSSNNKSSASHVLQAIGRNQFEARGSIRISLGRYNTEEEVNFFSDTLINSIKTLNPIFS